MEMTTVKRTAGHLMQDQYIIHFPGGQINLVACVTFFDLKFCLLS